MVYAAYAGTGKSYFCQEHPEAIDLICIKGYCEEACKAVIKQIFGEGLSVDHNQITVDRLYATTLAENTPAVELLKKIGFHGDNPEDGPILVMQGFLDEDKEINICPVIKMIYEKKSMCT